MLSVRHIRLALSRAATNNIALTGSKVIGVGPTKIHVATLKATHGEKYPYHPKPFPYETKTFNLWHETWEWASDRINENSKIIAVEGNVGVGKNKFAERLAAEFDLKYIASTSEESCHLHEDYDIRELDHLLPEGAKAYDVKKFQSDLHPECGKIGILQMQWFYERCQVYMKAANHLLSTGQGVVVVKSPFSDHVFADALKRMGWISNNFYDHYYEINKAALVELLSPHLTVYLDASTKTLQDRIKARNDPRDANARNLTDKYLNVIDTMYKERHLPQMRRTGEVLQIDWETEADDLDMDAIAEEISTYSFEGVDNEDPKFLQWTRLDEEGICFYRKAYQDVGCLNHVFAVRGFPYQCQELVMDYPDRVAFDEIVLKHPALKYLKGWAPQFGNLTALRL